MGVVRAFAVSVGVCARSVARVMLRSEVRSPPWYTFQVRNQELVSCLRMRVCGLLVLCVCKCVCVCEVSGDARACCGVHLRLVIKIWLCICFGGYYKWIVASV